jgi:hypothetical protein
VVEPITIGAIIAALIVKSQDKAIDATVEGGSKLLGGVVARLRSLLKRDTEDDAPEQRLLDRVVDAPDSPSRATELATALDARAAADPSFKTELERLSRDAVDAGIDAVAVTQQIFGDNNIQIANTSDSTISIDRRG